MPESRASCVSQSAIDQSPKYDRDQLLSLYTTTNPGAAVVARLRSLGLYTVCRLRCPRCRRRRCASRDNRLSLRRGDRLTFSRYRGCRAGRSHRSPPVIRSTSCGAFILVASSSPSSLADRLQWRSRPPSSLVKVRTERHSAPCYADMSFGCLNIRSLANKLDDLSEVRRDQLMDVMFLTETWHDSDSVSLSRLRADGFQVVDRPRPRQSADTMATNYGGVAAVAVQGVRLTRIDLGVTPGTFELLCVRVVSGSSSCVVAAVYRPGSVTVTAAFFGELSDVLDTFVKLVAYLHIGIFAHSHNFIRHNSQ